MSGLYEALRRAELNQAGSNGLAEPHMDPGRVSQATIFPRISLDHAPNLQPETPFDPRLVTLVDDDDPGAEQFRVLGLRLKDLRKDHQLRTILVTSSVAGEGKSVVAANLAISLARDNEQSVLLLGGDLRCLALNHLLGCNGLRGMSDYLKGDSALTHYLYRVESLPLWFLPSGRSSSQSVPLLQSTRLMQLLDTLSISFEWIVIDSPPLLPFADANIWARMADGTLLVVREGKTPKKPLLQALDSLGKATARNCYELQPA